MKLQKYYILSIIIIILTAISFDISSLKLTDNTLETKVEVSLEEKKSETESDKNMILSTLGLYPKETKVFTAYDFSTPIVNQFYLNNIFKPPIFS